MLAAGPQPENSLLPQAGTGTVCKDFLLWAPALFDVACWPSIGSDWSCWPTGTVLGIGPQVLQFWLCINKYSYAGKAYL